MYAKVGINTEILDIDIGIWNKPPSVIANREALIKNLAENKTTTSARNAFKFIGLTM